VALTFSGTIDTGKKLACLHAYLTAFSVALQNEGFGRVYIDAFAGSGDRTEIRPALPMFGEEPEVVTTPGSARLALSVTPKLDSVVLIEMDDGRYRSLERLKAETPDREIHLRQGDANEIVQRLCGNVNWRGPKTVGRGIRGVIFLDPFGMEVSWKTVEAIADTRALDCWYFFPLSGLYRNAPNRAANLTADKSAALDRIFGTHEWFDRWYASEAPIPTLFETPAEAVRSADVNAIEAYVKERLASAFKGAVLDPLRLRHNNGSPMASLFFAVSNESPAAVRLATQIASHLLKQRP
jgi:three-Cys-motif partner protein